jgi:hypothetical protein
MVTAGSSPAAASFDTGDGGESSLSLPVSQNTQLRIMLVVADARDTSPACPNFARMGRNEAGGAKCVNFFCCGHSILVSFPLVWRSLHPWTGGIHALTASFQLLHIF